MFVNPNKMWIVYVSIFLYFNTSIAQHVYTSIRIYVYIGIRLYTLHLWCFLHLLLSILPFPFLVSTSLFVRLRSSIDFYFAKVSQAENTANTGMLPIGRKLFMTLRNQRLRFPENFASQLFALCPLNACDLTLHIKGSR